MSSISIQGKEVLHVYKKKILTTVNSYVNSSESNNLDTSNSNNVIVNKTFIVSILKPKFHLIH